MTKRRKPKGLRIDRRLRYAISRNERLSEQLDQLFAEIWLTIVPETSTGPTLRKHDAPRRLRPDPVIDDEEAERLERELEKRGFRCHRRTSHAIGVSATPDAIADALGEPLIVSGRASPDPPPALQRVDQVWSPPQIQSLFVHPRWTLSPSAQIPGVNRLSFVPPPVEATSPAPPDIDFDTLDLEGVLKAYRADVPFDGSGSRVGLVDSGFHRHPLFEERGVALTSKASFGPEASSVDKKGHGTAMAGAVSDVAPGADIVGYKSLADPYYGTVDAATDPSTDILLLALGFENEQRQPGMEKAIEQALSAGVVVVCAAGNGRAMWPASMPGVIAVGGARPVAGVIEASNFASGFRSSLYEGRRVPDVSGLCGTVPSGIYLPFPTAPGSYLDKKYASLFPNGDGTNFDDGWIFATGTSNAAAHVAGCAAILQQAARESLDRRLTPGEMKAVLTRTGRRASRGRNAMGVRADQDPEGACGAGLVDLAAAVAELENL